jgi:LacI family transcriptional regulator
MDTMARRVTITEVAKAAGVSVATVSKVINGRYGVASQTSARVLQVVQDLGYESSLVARSLRSQRTNVIGILVAEFEPFSAEILKGAGAALRHSCYEVLAYAGTRDGVLEGWERRSLSRLSGTLIDGAILVTPSVVDVDVEIPLVAIDPHTGPEGQPSVQADNPVGSAMATRYLIELGHRRIAFLTGRPDLRSSVLREEGYRKALAEAGIPLDPSLVRAGYYSREAVRGSALELLGRADRPTAVFAANDLSALGTLDVAEELRLRVPQDLSVIGFDDIPEAVQARPSLTTVRQPIQQMGQVAVEQLIALLEGRELESTSITLPTSLVRRRTCGPPPDLIRT